MNNYDDILREKENNDPFNDNAMEKHWAALEKKFDTAGTKQPPAKYRKLLWSITGIAAVLILAFVGFTFWGQKTKVLTASVVVNAVKSAVLPPLQGANVPYEIYNFDATAGDTIFTLNGSIIIFPQNALLNSRGEVVKGNIELRTREFNDVFDYSIAGIPMDYDSAGVKYTFISSGMIDINAYQNGELLQVNPAAKPQLNLVSTNKETKTNLYKLDSVTGKWQYRGKDEVNVVGAKANANATDVSTYGNIQANGNGDASDFIESEYDVADTKPVAPQKASSKNPVITVSIDPASFKELLVYDGLRFEIIDNIAANSEKTVDLDKVGEDAATEWDYVELKKGTTEGTYKVKFSAKNKTAEYNVKPVLEGKDFDAAEKLYQEKLQAYERLQAERKEREKDQITLQAQNKKNLARDSAALQVLLEENKKTEELNELIELRNRFIEAENIRIEAINKENRKRWDAAIKENKEWAEKQKVEQEKLRIEQEKQQAVWNQQYRTQALQQNMLRSFNIDGFGYWNCDQPTLPATELYTSNFKTSTNEVVTYNTLCIAAIGINRVQNYYNTRTIGFIPNNSYTGWAFNENRFYYFTKQDFEKAQVTKYPNTISITMNLYEGDATNYQELKAFMFNVNNSTALK